MGPLQVCPETVPPLLKKCFSMVHGQSLHCSGCTGAFTSLLHHSLSIGEPHLVLAQCFWVFIQGFLVAQIINSFSSRT